MDIRIYKPLFFLFLFFFSSNLFAANSWKYVNAASNHMPKSEEPCNLKHFQWLYDPARNQHHIELVKCVFSYTDSVRGDYYKAFVYVYGFANDEPFEGCAVGQNPIYPAVSCPPPSCNSDEILNPETNTCIPAPTCPAEGTKDKSSYGPPNLLGFSACTANNCIIQVGTTDDLSLCTGGGTADEQCSYTTYYTGQACTYNPDNTTWNPPGHEWPEVPKPDLPVPDQPDLPLPDSGGGNGGYDPDAGIEDNFTPPNPDTSPDTDNPNLGAEGNAGVVNELNSANKSLQNIEAILTQTRKDQNENAATQERYNSGILGAINSIDKSVSGASGSGGGGGNGDGDSGSGCDPEKEQCESGLNFGRPELKDPFENILDASDIAEVQAKTTDIKTSLKSKIDEIKNLISVPKYETGGSVPAVEFSLQHGDSNIQVKNDALSRISPDIANIITLVVAVICFGIVAARR